MNSNLMNLAGHQLWQVTLLAGIVAVVSRTLARKRPHLSYCLWVLVVIKCLTPPIFSSPMSAFSWALAERPVESTPTEPFRIAAPNATSSVPSTESRTNETPQEANTATSESISSTRPMNEHQGESLFSGAPVPSTISPVETNESALEIVKTKDTLRAEIPWATILAIVWCGGMGCLVAFIVCRRLVIFRVMRHYCEPAGPELEEEVRSLADKLGIPCRIRLLVCSRVLGPAVFGIFRPTIVMPASLVNRKAVRDLQPILAHELLHVRRGDLVMGTIQAIAQICWWFHPLVWWANREVSRERERCCDEEVVAAMGCDPEVYAQSLIDVLRLRRQMRPLYTPSMGAAEITTRRLEHIMGESESFQRRTPRWCLALALLIATIVLPGAALKLPAIAQERFESTTPRDTTAPAAKRKRTPTGATTASQTRASIAVPGFKTGSGEWPRPRGNAHNSGVASGAMSHKLQLSWEFKAKNAKLGSPVVSAGRLFIGDERGQVLAIDVRTGKQLWVYEAKDTGFIAAPAVQGERVYIGDDNGRCICLSAKTGKLLWTFQTDAEITGAANFSGRHVLFGSQDAVLYCVDNKTGKLLWKSQIADQIRSTPTIVDNDIYLVGCDGVLHVLNLKTGKRVAELSFGAPSGVTPAYYDGQIVFGDESGVLHCVDRKTAQLLWTKQLDNNTPIRGSAAMTEKLVVATGKGNRIMAFQRKTGKIVWEFNGGRTTMSPVVSGNLVIAGTTGGRIFGLELTTGRMLWKYETGGRVGNSVAIANGQLFVTNNRGVVFCFSATQPPIARAAPLKPKVNPLGGERNVLPPLRGGTTRPDDVVSLVNLGAEYAEWQEQLITETKRFDRLKDLHSRQAIADNQLAIAESSVRRLKTRLRVTKELVELAIESTADELKSMRQVEALAKQRFQAGELDALRYQQILGKSRAAQFRLVMLKKVLTVKKE